MKERKPKPFPHRCPECGKQEVYPETIRYKTSRKVSGVLYTFETPDVIVNKCRHCGQYSIPQRTLDQVEEYFQTVIVKGK
jgi:uncharacterized Zn finger protein